jgi:hypothetical protein
MDNPKAMPREIAAREKPHVPDASPSLYFEFPVGALHGRDNQGKTVVPMDDRDAPVTRAMTANRKLAKDIAREPRDFFTDLKQSPDHVPFAMLTGMTRYSLACDEWGPNHLHDASVDSTFAGVRGFTPRIERIIYLGKVGQQNGKNTLFQHP